MRDNPGASLTAERLFERYFWPLYPEDVRADLAAARAADANPGRNPSIPAALDDAASRFAALAATAFNGVDLALDGSDASVHRLGAAINRDLRARWQNERGPDGVPLLAHVVIHGAA